MMCGAFVTPRENIRSAFQFGASFLDSFHGGYHHFCNRIAITGDEDNTMMKSLISATALSLALTASAFAADLPSRKEAPVYVPPPPPPLWTGFYGGLNAGGTFGGSNTVTTTGGTIFANPFFGPFFSSVTNAYGATTNTVIPVSNAGFIGGGQVGYNYQFYSAFVAGLEADIQGVAGSSSRGNVATGALFNGGGSAFGVSTASRSLEYLGTVRGRLGYLFTPTLLAYATGGLAYGGANLNTASFATDNNLGGLLSPLAIPVIGGSAYSDTRVGWTVGGGLEWMFMPNWSAKVEYLYYDLGTVTNNASFSAVAENPAIGLGSPVFGLIGQQSHARFDGHIVRAGVNYHFNWAAPAPVLAKY
jgi:outer membrane immunogenic protein